MKSNILVLGGTGKTGKRVAQKLTDLNYPVRIGSRSAIPAFDWDNKSNWQEVLQGIEKVYITIQPDLASAGSVEKIQAFVEEAKAANVQKLVLLSGRGEKEAQACEDAVINSGIDFTVLRASWFMQNFSESFLLDGILAGEVVLPEVKTSEPFIDVDDIAEVAVEALLTEKHANTIYELTGPELLTFREAVKLISNQLDRPVNYVEVPLQEYLEILRSYQIPLDFVALVEYLFTTVLDGRNAYTTSDVDQILARKATNFIEYAQKTAHLGIWAAPQLSYE